MMFFILRISIQSCFVEQRLKIHFSKMIILIFSYSSWHSTNQGSGDVFINQINASDRSLLNGYQEGSVELDQMNSLALKGDSLFFAGFRFDFSFVLLFLFLVMDLFIQPQMVNMIS